jgi:hypothetical protein
MVTGSFLVRVLRDGLLEVGRLPMILRALPGFEEEAEVPDIAFSTRRWWRVASLRELVEVVAVFISNTGSGKKAIDRVQLLVVS